MTFESPTSGVPERIPPPEPGSNDSINPVDAERIGENINIIANQRVIDEINVGNDEARLSEISSILSEVIAGEKELRIKRIRLNAERENLRTRVNEQKRERLRKNELISNHRARLAAIREELKYNGIDDVARLERRVSDLQSDVAAFRDTLEMHRRDRERVVNLLFTAQSNLQDILTEQILWRIVELENEQIAGEQGSALAGVTAELLGRIMVLEKIDSQIKAVLNRQEQISSGENLKE